MTEATEADWPPDQLRQWLSDNPRLDVIDKHGFTLNLQWWNERIEHLPGTPLIGIGQKTDTDRIDRRLLFGLASDAASDESGEAALRLFWHAMAWGSGTNHRNSPRVISSVARNPHAAAKLLTRSALASLKDPRSAFLLLRPRGNAISSLGPNFFTKYLYFAGGGTLEHPSLIVDKRVLKSLHRETERAVFKPRSTNYGASTYEAAISQMASWATALSTAERKIGFDEVERWAFATGGRA